LTTVAGVRSKRGAWSVEGIVCVEWIVCAESSRRSRQCKVKSKNIFCSCAFVFAVVPLFSQLWLCFHSFAILLYDSYIRFCSCACFLQLCNFFAVVHFFAVVQFADIRSKYDTYLVFLTKNCYTLLTY
jgi:hypothetical protein